MTPLCIDLYCGLGGFSEGFLAEGYSCIGFDIERHEYGEHKYPAQLVLQDVLTLHGRQFKDATIIICSPPCTEFSYMAMPWKRGKQIARALHGIDTFPDGYEGSRTLAELTALFDACFRIQREAIKAAGRHIPLIVENVRGAQPWVGQSRWAFGSFHLFGDVPALMPMTAKRSKVPGFRFDGSGKYFQTAAVEHTKNTGGSWFNVAHNTTSGNGNNLDGRKYIMDDIKNGQRRSVEGLYEDGIVRKGDGIKQRGGWFYDSTEHSLRRHSSKSSARKMASAMVAKIPLVLSRHIARTYYPR